MMRSTDTWHGRPWRHGHRRRRGQHAFGAAGVDHDRRVRRTGGQSPFERRHDAAAFAGAAVFGGQHEIDVEVAKQVQAEQFLAATRAVEQRQSDAARAERCGKRGKRRQADAAGHHPGLGRRVDGRKRPAKRSEHGHALAVARRCRRASSTARSACSGARWPSAFRPRREGLRTRKRDDAAADRGRPPL